mmetsp:Transcript_31499/g.35975  ORF Transcript_31499/g.35975 Transcript_31499/m.35975 type:complete len:189 (-) Transcript_31499:432-998(-)
MFHEVESEQAQRLRAEVQVPQHRSSSRPVLKYGGLTERRNNLDRIFNRQTPNSFLKFKIKKSKKTSGTTSNYFIRRSKVLNSLSKTSKCMKSTQKRLNKKHIAEYGLRGHTVGIPMSKNNDTKIDFHPQERSKRDSNYSNSLCENHNGDKKHDSKAKGNSQKLDLLLKSDFIRDLMKRKGLQGDQPNA